MLTLILGGARSGKSDLALRLAAASNRDVLFVATMEGRDAETRARIDAHRAARPAAWRTVEAPHDPLATIEREAPRAGFVLLDCLTLWVSNLLLERLGDAAEIDPAQGDAAVAQIRSASAALAGWARAYDGDVAVVSNEVGLGVVPAYPLGRWYRDALGAANRSLAAQAGRVYWLTAGLALELKSLGAMPVEAFGTGPQA
jgi:adenosylcobinamide kinase/adenosylcobinamide-phosphate guanylyltransferase